MPRLLSRAPLSPRARRGGHVFAAVSFACVAAVSWWQVATEGATPARMLAAVFGTIVVVLEVFFPGRKRLVRRRERSTGVDEHTQLPSQEEEQ